MIRKKQRPVFGKDRAPAELGEHFAIDRQAGRGGAAPEVPGNGSMYGTRRLHKHAETRRLGGRRRQSDLLEKFDRALQTTALNLGTLALGYFRAPIAAFLLAPQPVDGGRKFEHSDVGVRELLNQRGGALTAEFAESLVLYVRVWLQRKNAVAGAIALAAFEAFFDKAESLRVKHGIVEIARVRSVVVVLIIEPAVQAELVQQIGRFLQPHATDQPTSGRGHDGGDDVFAFHQTVSLLLGLRALSRSDSVSK